MTTINRNALVPYSSAQMFDLVNDIEAYPRFLPWCTGSEVLRRDEDEVQARLDLVKGGGEEAFTTVNRMQKNNIIEMRLVEGPFHRLEGFWRFQNLGDQGCKVSLDLEFEFANKLVGLAMGPMFTQIANTLVDSFCTRAADVYG